MAIELEDRGGGVFAAPGALIIDRSGRKRLAIGNDGFASAMSVGTIVDKTMLIADVLDSGYKATLFCRPRRFGKTLNMTMLKAYLEAPEAGGLSREAAEALFAGTDVWETDGGAYRQHQGAYPVVHVSFKAVECEETWPDCLAGIESLIRAEYARHGYLAESTALNEWDRAYFARVASGEAPAADYAHSLATLCRLLRTHHGRHVVVLVDEYDAPAVAGDAHGYRDRAVSFLNGWLVGALKDGGAALAFACMAGVWGTSRGSIYPEVNNLCTSLPLSSRFDERYGFTDAEVEALATYLGHPGCMQEAREWYDGYRFGDADVYNPWSVINYLNKGCRPGTYWGNTSGNSVLGELVSRANAETLDDVYSLLEPGGTVDAPLDLGVVFPELWVRGDAIWSMLYLSGYLTTDDTEDPSDEMRPRPLRVPDREVARLFRNEVLGRFRSEAGGVRRLQALHRALLSGDAGALGEELLSVLERASYHDLTSELACHMLLMGLLFGVAGYRDPVSNREYGQGRPDIRLEPDPSQRARGSRPLVTVEVKFARDADDAALDALAAEALAQIADRAYDAGLPDAADGRLRWGVAFSGKRVACACERA